MLSLAEKDYLSGGTECRTRKCGRRIGRDVVLLLAGRAGIEMYGEEHQVNKKQGSYKRKDCREGR